MTTALSSPHTSLDVSPIRLADPLPSFPWPSLADEYDEYCERFSSSSPYLAQISPNPQSDRVLYKMLLSRFAEELASENVVTFDTYLAMLYWKLYSQGAAIANTCKVLVENSQEKGRALVGLRQLSSRLRGVSTERLEDVLDLIQDDRLYCFRGMKSKDAFPVRTTFLHFARPEEVPIFDKQVLMAIGIAERNANHDVRYLRAYIPHARSLAREHAHMLPNIGPEKALRLIDMALWVMRGKSRKEKSRCRI
jgi:hypothetical protein